MDPQRSIPPPRIPVGSNNVLGQGPAPVNNPKKPLLEELKPQGNLANASNGFGKSDSKEAQDKKSRLNQEQANQGGKIQEANSQEYEYDDQSSESQDDEEDSQQGQYEDSSQEEEQNKDLINDIPQKKKEIPNSEVAVVPPSQSLDDQFDKEKLDRMYKFPASYKEAMVHKMASKFGFATTKIKRDQKEENQLQAILASFMKNQKANTSNNIVSNKNIGQLENKVKKFQKVPICPCCENYISNVEIPICYPTEPPTPKEGEPKFLLQTGVSMYFSFIKTVILYLLLRFFIFDSVNIYFSMNGHYCSTLQAATPLDNCEYTTISGYNLNSLQDTKALDILDYISLGLTVVSIICFIIYKRKQARMISWLERNNKSQKDFSIMIENIPAFIHQNEVKKKDVKYEYQVILKQKLEKIIRQWLEQIFEAQSVDELDYFQHHFFKFVYERKAREEKEDAEEKKKNAKSADTKKKNTPELVTEQDYKKYVKDIILSKQIIVPSVTICYDLTELQAMNKMRDELVKEYIKSNEGKVLDANSPQLKNNQLLSHIPNQIDLLNQQYIKLCNKLALDDSPHFALSHFTGKAILCFQYKYYRDIFLMMYEQDEDFLKLNDQSLKISRTNKPEDIYWYNMKVSDTERKKNIFYSYAILFMLLILSFASLVGLQYLQKNTTVPANSQKILDKIKSNVLSIGMAIVTNIINFILSSSIELLSDMEKHKTKSDRLSSLIIKIIVTQTINTSFIYFILYILTPTNPLGKAGLVKNVSDLVIVSGFISVVLQIFPPGYLIAKVQNYFRYQDKQEINMFQLQLNQILQDPEFNFAAMYAFYIVFTFVVSFYGFLAPTTTPVLIIIFFLQYWVDKYNLFKRYSCPVDFGAELIKKIFIVFQTALVICALGHFVWDMRMHTDQSPLARIVMLANLGIAAIFCGFEIFAPDRIKSKVFPFEQEECDPYSYTSYQKDDTFKKTFFRENPATSCLKQTKLNVGKVKKAKKPVQQFVYEAPDPEFIPQHQRIFQKFLELEQRRKILERYKGFDQEYYQKMDDSDWDEVEAEQRHREEQKKLRKGQKDKDANSDIPDISNMQSKRV